jgi:hypothetical protein
MSELSPALYTELQSSRPLIFGWVQIQFPGYTLRLLDGAGEIVMGGNRYVGRDDTYGVLDTIKGLSDKLDGKAPEVTVGFIPATGVAINSFLDPSVQGSAVSIGLGAADMTTGIAVDSGYTLFTGFLDVPTITWGDNNRRLEYTCTSVGERLFMTEEGRRLSNAFHQQVWPGETGLYAVTDIEQSIYWGQAAPAPAYSPTPSYGGSDVNGGYGRFSEREINAY